MIPTHLLRSILITSILFAPLAVAAKPVTLEAADGVKVQGDYLPDSAGSTSDRPVILLFHMASSNRGEYAGIASRLNGLGFDTLAIDQRSGGRNFRQDNETVKGLGRSTGFLDALKDLEAATAFARRSGTNRKIIVWGSSYSASLVFALAAKEPNGIVGLLAFSPGEYFGTALNVKKAAGALTIPVFVTSASDPGEVQEAKAIVESTKGRKTQFIPKAGLHGSSTLREDANRAGAAENWAAVEAFLKTLK